MYVCRSLLSPRVGCALAIIFSLAFLVGCPLPPTSDTPDGSDQGAVNDGDQGSQNPPGGSGASDGSANDQDDSSGDANGGAGSDGSDGGDDGNGGGENGDDGTEAVAPRIAGIADDYILVGERYTGPRPSLLQGTPPISWSLEVGPLALGMTISASTGVVSWPHPVEGEHAIVIAAAGPGGADTEGWTLFVERAEAQTLVALVSVGLNGQANEESESASVSADGRFVAFSSQASNLVMGDTGIDRDVFVRDRDSAQTIRVTLGHDGAEPDGPSLNPVISANGQYVAFQSSATNLDPNRIDDNEASDIFVWDRATHAISLVSVSSAGALGDSGSQNPAISADGRYVAFESVAGNLVDDDTNDRGDVFVHDRQTGQTWRVSLSSAGDEALGDAPSPFLSFDAAISADGRYVAFASYAFNLVADDTNDVADIFLHDTVTGETLRISRGADGFETDGDSRGPHVAGPDAQFVVFESEATTICACDVNGQPDVYLLDRVSGATVAISVRSDGEAGNGSSGAPMLSEDGRYVVFESLADDLVDDDDNGVADIFVHDTWLGTTMMRSVDRQGIPGDDDSLRPYLTPDGRFVVFESKATNLTDDLDLGHFSDIFIRSLAE
jgi:Tol biopolymer transport system component